MCHGCDRGCGTSGARQIISDGLLILQMRLDYRFARRLVSAFAVDSAPFIVRLMDDIGEHLSSEGVKKVPNDK